MLEELQEIVRHYINNKDIIITESTLLISDLELNSYELVQMVCDIEDKFDIEIPDREIGGFKTVQDVLDFITGSLRRE